MVVSTTNNNRSAPCEKREEEAKIKRIKELIEEYADCREEMDLQKVAIEIYDLAGEDYKIASNMKDYWKHQRSGAER